MELDLSKYTLEEITSLRDKCNSYIYNYSDGFVYICKVRSYGSNWHEHMTNLQSLQELCHRYYGYDGIVDVYSTNPDIFTIDNYGDLAYIESEDDYNKWKDYNLLVNEIKMIEKQLDEWDNRENVPFNQRPKFEPYCTRGELDELKKQLEDYDMSFVPPKYTKS